MKLGKVCEHGSLTRSCLILIAERDALRAGNEFFKTQCANWSAKYQTLEAERDRYREALISIRDNKRDLSVYAECQAALGEKPE